MEKMRMESVDIKARNIEKIGELFPNCITEMLDEEKSTPEKKVYKKAVNFVSAFLFGGGWKASGGRCFLYNVYWYNCV